jgi:hypothetical protein
MATTHMILDSCLARREARDQAEPVEPATTEG